MEKRVQLSESFGSFITKAKRIEAYMREDWLDLAENTADETMVERLAAAIAETEQAVSTHREEYAVESDAQLNNRQAVADLRTTLREVKARFALAKPTDLFHLGQPRSYQSYLKKYPLNAKLYTVAQGVEELTMILQKLSPRPKFCADDILDGYMAVVERYRKGLVPLQLEKSEQPILRLKRDQKIRKLRSLVRIGKELGRFTYRDNPVKLPRYR